MASDDDDEIRRTGLGSRAEWHPDTVSRLIDGYGEKCANIKGYLKTKDWEEIVKYVNIQCEGSKIPKTMKQCREKIDSLKRRYKMEKRRAEIRGSSHVEWSFFEKLDDIMRNLRRTGNVSEGQSFEVTEALDFEVAEPVGFDGDSRLNFVISKSADRVGFHGCEMHTRKIKVKMKILFGYLEDEDLVDDDVLIMTAVDFSLIKEMLTMTVVGVIIKGGFV